MSAALPVVSGRETLRALQRAGFALRKVRGSHHILTHAGPPLRMVSVPLHGNKTLAIGTLAAVLKQAGLSTEQSWSCFESIISGYCTIV